MTEQRHIVAFGGGGFLMEQTPVLDDFVLSIARRPRPRICYVPTASRDDALGLARFYRAFAHRDCVASDLTLQGAVLLPRRPARTDELRDYVLDRDVIYVGGDLRRRRQHGEPARAVANARARQDPRGGVAQRYRARRRQRGHDLLVRGVDHGLLW